MPTKVLPIPPGMSVTNDHSKLTNLNHDDHPQYLTAARAAGTYITRDQTTPQTMSGGSFAGSGGLGVSSGLLGVDLSRSLIFNDAGDTRAVVYTDPAGNTVKVEVFNDAALTDYSAADVPGSIQWAIEQLYDVGGTVLIYPGIYPLTNSLDVDGDWITLQGINKTHWNNGPYPDHGTPGDPGGAQLVASADKNAISVGGAGPTHGDTRHKGLAFRDLYLYGQNTAIYGIEDTVRTDISEISNCTIMGFTVAAIKIGWDTPQIVNNNIQDNDGDGIQSSAIYGIIHGNLICDCGGVGIRLGSQSQGSMVSGNSLVRLAGGGVSFDAAGSNIVHGNYFDLGSADPIMGNTAHQLVYGNRVSGTNNTFELAGGINIPYGSVLKINELPSFPLADRIIQVSSNYRVANPATLTCPTIAEAIVGAQEYQEAIHDPTAWIKVVVHPGVYPESIVLPDYVALFFDEGAVITGDAGDTPSDYFIDVTNTSFSLISGLRCYGPPPDVRDNVIQIENGAKLILQDSALIYNSGIANLISLIGNSQLVSDSTTLAALNGSCIKTTNVTKAAGTTTSVVASKLVDSTADFVTALVAPSDVVYNTATYLQTTVVSVEDLHTLVLDDDIFTDPAQPYQVAPQTAGLDIHAGCITRIDSGLVIDADMGTSILSLGGSTFDLTASNILNGSNSQLSSMLNEKGIYQATWPHHSYADPQKYSLQAGLEEIAYKMLDPDGGHTHSGEAGDGALVDDASVRINAAIVATIQHPKVGYDQGAFSRMIAWTFDQASELNPATCFGVEMVDGDIVFQSETWKEDFSTYNNTGELQAAWVPSDPTNTPDTFTTIVGGAHAMAITFNNSSQNDTVAIDLTGGGLSDPVNFGMWPNMIRLTAFATGSLVDADFYVRLTDWASSAIEYGPFHFTQDSVPETFELTRYYGDVISPGQRNILFSKIRYVGIRKAAVTAEQTGTITISRIAVVILDAWTATKSIEEWETANDVANWTTTLGSLSLEEATGIVHTGAGCLKISGLSVNGSITLSRAFDPAISLINDGTYPIALRLWASVAIGTSATPQAWTITLTDGDGNIGVVNSTPGTVPTPAGWWYPITFMLQDLDITKGTTFDFSDVVGITIVIASSPLAGSLYLDGLQAGLPPYWGVAGVDAATGSGAKVMVHSAYTRPWDGFFGSKIDGNCLLRWDVAFGTVWQMPGGPTAAMGMIEYTGGTSHPKLGEWETADTGDATMMARISSSVLWYWNPEIVKCRVDGLSIIWKDGVPSGPS